MKEEEEEEARSCLYLLIRSNSVTGIIYTIYYNTCTCCTKDGDS